MSHDAATYSKPKQCLVVSQDQHQDVDMQFDGPKLRCLSASLSANMPSVHCWKASSRFVFSCMTAPAPTLPILSQKSTNINIIIIIIIIVITIVVNVVTNISIDINIIVVDGIYFVL